MNDKLYEKLFTKTSASVDNSVPSRVEQLCFYSVGDFTSIINWFLYDDVFNSIYFL